jgi:hypothetical protein
MNVAAPSVAVASTSALPRIHEATRVPDGSEAVIRGAELTQAEAVARRKGGAILLFAD